jgi:predicted aspartyl protease
VSHAGDGISSLISVYVAGLAAVALIDTGSSISLLSGPFFRRLRQAKKRFDEQKKGRKLRCANNLPMDIIAEVDTSIKLGGVGWPASFVVVEKLVYDVIIGMDILHGTKAVIDTNEGTLTLFDGLTAISMTPAADEQLIVKTTNSFDIPPYSEAVITVSCLQKPVNSDYVIENDIRLPCKNLFVGRTLVDATKEFLPCRVMNPTDKIIRLKAQTPVGVLAAVEVNEIKVRSRKSKAEKELTTAEKRAALEAKSISLKETILKGIDLENLIDLLYDNIDLFATSLAELPGCDLLMQWPVSLITICYLLVK